MDEFDEIVREFLVESYENLDQLDRDLVALEQEPDAHPLLQSIFRTIHTIKGTSGFLAFGKLEVLTHAGEGLLARLRDGGLRLTQDRTTGLLELVDAVRSILASIEATGVENDRDYTDLVARLTALQTHAPEALASETLASEASASATLASEAELAGATTASRSRSTKVRAQAETPSASVSNAAARQPEAAPPHRVSAKPPARPRRRASDRQAQAATASAGDAPSKRSIRPTGRTGCQARHQSGACRAQGERECGGCTRKPTAERPAAR